MSDDDTLVNVLTRGTPSTARRHLAQAAERLRKIAGSITHSVTPSEEPGAAPRAEAVVLARPFVSAAAARIAAAAQLLDEARDVLAGRGADADSRWEFDHDTRVPVFPWEAS